MLKKTIFCSFVIFSTLLPLTATTVAQPASHVSKHALDSVITLKVKALYAQSPLIKMLDISVNTHRQRVQLQGEVDTDLQYERAILLAESVEGVKDVNGDGLTVKASEKPFSDMAITAKIKGTFLKEKFFGKKKIEYWPVSVETKNAVVYLTGQVSTTSQQKQLLHLAQTIQGVKAVKSFITVSK